MPRNRLNDQQSHFAELMAQGIPPVDAYLTAYPGCSDRHTASVNAARLAKHPLVAAVRADQSQRAVAAVDRALERYGITADRVADQMARLAFTALRQVADVRTVTEGGKRKQVVVIRDFDDIDADAHEAISEVRRMSGGEIVVKLYNKSDALMNLARLKGWIADKPADARALVMLKVER